LGEEEQQPKPKKKKHGKIFRLLDWATKPRFKKSPQENRLRA
jgi:hypothetical protein